MKVRATPEPIGGMNARHPAGILFSEPAIHLAAPEYVLHVEDHRVRLREAPYRLDPHLAELAMAHRDHYGVVVPLAQLGSQRETELMMRLARIDPRIVDIDVRIARAQIAH